MWMECEKHENETKSRNAIAFSHIHIVGQTERITFTQRNNEML